MNFRLDSCCGCINLRVGCLIIGYLSMITELTIAIFCALGLYTEGVVADDGVELDKKGYMLLGGAIAILSVILLAKTLLYLVFTVYLLIGLHKNHRGYILAFLIFSTFFVILRFAFWIAALTHPPVNTTFTIGYFCVIVVTVYSLLVIRSYYYKMDDQMKPLSNSP